MIEPAGRRRCAWLLALVLVWLPGAAQDYGVDWSSLDGGGELFSETADGRWQLSGTIGQWDGSESLELGGQGWRLTGGFWPATVDATDRLFFDGFES